MIKIIFCSLCLILMLATEISVAQPLSFEYNPGTPQINLSTFENSLNQLVQDFTATLDPEFLQKKCQIKLKFGILDGYWASVDTEKSLAALNSACRYEMQMDQRLISKVEARLALIHELIHVIRHQYNPTETRWLDEGMAQVIETEHIGLWPADKATQLEQNDRIFLSNENKDYSPRGRGYSTSYFFMKYLYDHYGRQQLFQILLKSPLSGWENIEAALQTLSQQGHLRVPPKYLNRQSIWTQFSMAILLNEASRADYGLFLLDTRWKKEAVSSSLFSDSKSFNTIFESETIYLSNTSVSAFQSMNLHEFKIYGLQTDPQFLIERINANDQATTEKKYKSLIFIKN